MSLWSALRHRGPGAALLTALRVSSSPWTPALRTVDVELTNACQQRCAWCPTGQRTMGRSVGAMTETVFERLVSQLTPRTVLEFAGYGEPFLHPHLEAFLDMAHAQTLAVDIYSNLGAVSEQRLVALLDRPFRRLIISMDAMSRESFRAYKGVDQYDQVRACVETLAAERRRRPGLVGREIVVQCVVTRQNAADADAFTAWVQTLGVTPRLKSLNVMLIDCADAARMSWQVPGYTRDASEPTRRCPWVWGGAMVLWSGNVTVCCEDPQGREVHGNVMDQPLDVIVGRARADFRRRYFRDPRAVPICSGCHEA